MVDQLEAQADTSSRHVVEDTPEPNYSDIDEDKEFDESLATPLGAAGFTTLDYGKSIAMIEALELKPLVTYHLKKAGITTIDELMTRMQQEALTTIKGIKEKSAKQILEALAKWQKGGTV